MLESRVATRDFDFFCLIQECFRASLKEESSDSNSMCKEDAFSTPCFKAIPNAFVARRSHYSNQPECSPLPDTLIDFADEDTWMRMNKGYIADLDSVQITPARKVQSFPPGNVTFLILTWLHSFFGFISCGSIHYWI